MRRRWLAVVLAAALPSCAPTIEVANNASTDGADRRLGRNRYSPEVASDRYVLDQQRAVADALRRSCERTGEHCELADGARRYLDEQDASR